MLWMKPSSRWRRPGRKQLSLRQGVLAFMVAVSLLAIAVTCQVIWSARVGDIRVSTQQSLNLVQSLSQQATDSFQTIDVVLADLADRVQTDGMQPRQLERLQRLMAENVKRLRLLHGLSIADAGGNRLVSAAPGLKHVNYRDRPYFVYHRTHASLALHIGHAVRSRIDGTWIITVTRRLNRRDGSFAGVAMASLTGKYFHDLYEHVDLGRSGGITLALADGTILARKPFDPANIGRSVTKARFFELAQQRPSGTYENRSVIDGVTRLGAFDRVRDYPLLIVVAVGKVEALAAWRTQVLIDVAELAGLLAIVGILGGYLARQIGKRERAEAQLERLALTDGLTGLGNRYQFDAVLAREWRRAVRAGSSLAFLMIDVDDFKGYNDRYGHQAGDSVLKALACCISGAIGRSGDLAARYGGEEFAVILPDTDAAGAYQVGETIRRAVTALNIAHLGSRCGFVTMSIGVGRMSPTASTAPFALVREADAALYEAKNKGRNRTESKPIFQPALAELQAEGTSQATALISA